MWSSAKSWMTRDSQGRQSTRLMKEKQKIINAARVLKLMKGGVLLLDEIDVILHPLRSELNWPLGQKVHLVCDSAFGTFLFDHVYVEIPAMYIHRILPSHRNQYK